MTSSYNDNDITGDRNKPPKLMNISNFANWKYRIEQHFHLIDSSLWISVIDGPHLPTTSTPDGMTQIPKRVEDYSENDKKLMDRDKRALAALSMALPNELIHLFKIYNTAHSMWQALLERYEGDEEAKEDRRDMLRKQYEQFLILKGESVAAMINRYTHLISDLKTESITFTVEQANKKLLDALPNNWNMIIMMIKKMNNLKTMTLDELIGLLKSYDKGMNRNVYAETISPYTQLSNSALVSEFSSPTKNYGGSVSATTYMSQSIPASPHTTPSSPTVVSNSTANQLPHILSHINKDNLEMLCNFLTCYDAFAAGTLHQPQFTPEDMEQINADDLEEMDLQWQMAMLTVRTRKFFKRTGRKSFADPKRKLGFDKAKVQCYNCQQLGHFARECTLPKSQAASTSSNSAPAKSQTREVPITSTEKALVSQQIDNGYDWSLQAEELLPVNTAFMATIDESGSSEVTSGLCSAECIEKVMRYRNHNITLINDYQKLSKVNDNLMTNEHVWEDKVKALQNTIDDLNGIIGEKNTQIHDLLSRFAKQKIELAETRESLVNSELKLKQLHKSSEALKHALSQGQTTKTGLGYNEVPPPNDYITVPSKTVFVKAGLLFPDPVSNSAALSENSDKLNLSNAGSEVKVESSKMEKEENRIEVDRNDVKFVNDVKDKNIDFSHSHPLKSVSFDITNIASSSNASILTPVTRCCSDTTVTSSGKQFQQHTNHSKMAKHTMFQSLDNSSLSKKGLVNQTPKFGLNVKEPIPFKINEKYNKPVVQGSQTPRTQGIVPNCQEVSKTSTLKSMTKQGTKLPKPSQKFEYVPKLPNAQSVPKVEDSKPKAKAKVQYTMSTSPPKVTLKQTNDSNDVAQDRSNMKIVKTKVYDKKGRPYQMSMWVPNA